ncbi:hypothetical protein [Gymnodinialimonas sp. 57CJ19]|uniref:hypothetical protein n=1 Tax=Gymnodinialimonas sp. 57CJ19 TaxID=3138498 RepID=UPI00313439FD
MMTRFLPQQHARAALTFGFVAAVIYVTMITGTLAHLQALSGLVPFDMRPMGYSGPEAATLLDALGASGRHYYLSRQIPLDTAYPALLAATLVSTNRFLTAGRPVGWQRLASPLAIGAALCDYAENAGIVAMILNMPHLPAPLVAATSAASVAKALLTTGAVTATLLLAGGCLWARWRGLRAEG